MVINCSKTLLMPIPLNPRNRSPMDIQTALDQVIQHIDLSKAEMRDVMRIIMTG